MDTEQTKNEPAAENIEQLPALASGRDTFNYIRSACELCQE